MPQPAPGDPVNDAQLNELLYQALETEIGGVHVYETAVRCARNPDLKGEWEKYLEETRSHVDIVMTLFSEVGLDPEADTPGREIVRFKGTALVQAMESALNSGDPILAEIVAAEAVVDAETKDHANWQLVGRLAELAPKRFREALGRAHEQVEEQEDEHLYHTVGWARELWIGSLGLPAVLPPPEEQKSVKTAIGAARAEQSREDMLDG